MSDCDSVYATDLIILLLIIVLLICGLCDAAWVENGRLEVTPFSISTTSELSAQTATYQGW